MRYLFLFFIIMPIAEMWLLIEVGQLIGAPLTIAAVVATAALGVYWLRQQGLATFARLNQRLQSGELPAQELAEGFMLAIGGALLLTPGFVTDMLGFSCLFPLSRRWLARSIYQQLAANRVQAAVYTSHGSKQNAAAGPRRGPQAHSDAISHPKRDRRSETIEGEYTVEED